MTRSFCDRCDDEATRLTTVTVPSVIGQVRKVDLCDRCLDRLRDWVAPVPRAAVELKSA